MRGINLATRIYVDNRRINLLLLFVTAVAGVVLAVNAWLLVVQYQELTQLRSSLAAGAESLQQGRKPISEAEFQQLQAKTQFASGILLRRGATWLRLLDRLEQVVPEGVMLTAIEPDSRTGALKISGLATDFRKVRLFYESIGTSPLFRDVFLISQARVKVTEQQQGINFSMTARVTE